MQEGLYNNVKDPHDAETVLHDRTLGLNCYQGTDELTPEISSAGSVTRVTCST